MSSSTQAMISVYLAYIQAAKPVPVTGSLERFRDFIYIDDVVDGYMLALHDERTYGEVYNLGSGVTHTVREVLDLLIESCGRDPKTYPVDEIEGHAGDIFGMHSDSTKFQTAFAWKLKVTLRQCIDRMAVLLRE